jgi:hypothetical protein
MSVQVCDYSDDVISQHDLRELKIDPIIVHLVSVNGPDWSATVSSSGTDSNLSRRALDVVAQIMDLDLSKESDKDQAQRLLEQEKEDGPGGAEDVLDNSAGLDMESGIREFWTWIEKGNKDHTEAMLEADTRERNVGTTTVTEDERMIEAGARESNADTARVTQTESMGAGGARESSAVTASVTGNSTNTSKKKVAGEKRKRHTFTTSQTCYLQVQLDNRLLDTPEGRQNVAVVFTKESGQHCDVGKINTWVRNHKKRKGGGGEPESGGS